MYLRTSKNVVLPSFFSKSGPLIYLNVKPRLTQSCSKSTKFTTTFLTSHKQLPTAHLFFSFLIILKHHVFSKKKTKATVEKIELDKSNAQLKKHIVDWFEKHPNQKFISPMQFQNAYPQWDKYTTKSFSVPFYAIKTNIKNGKK